MDGQILKLTVDSQSKAPELGRGLVIDLKDPLKADQLISLKIDFSTAKGQSQKAITWISAPQTLDKKLSYVYSGCQTILCRQLFPHQDSP